MAKVFVVGNVSAEEATLKLQEVKEARPKDSYTDGVAPKIEKNDDGSITDVTFDAGKFKIVAADHNIGRDIDAAWFGLQIFAPEEMEKEDLDKATYDNGENTTKKYFARNEDTQEKDKSTSKNRFIYVYGAITEEILTNAIKNGTSISYTWRFDWNDDGKIDQIVNVKVQPDKLELKDEKGEETLWNGTIAKMVEAQSKTENATETEENKTTEGNKKDDVPKTGEVIPMV